MMDIRLLKHFLALAETLHFGKASKLCHVSSSALSRNIKMLETELGVEVFLRDNRSVELTPAGQQFLEYAKDSLLRWDSLRYSLQQSQTDLSGEISMYCSVTASYSFLHDLLSQFRLSYPKIAFKLHTGDPDLSVLRVLDGLDDMAIAACPGRLPKGTEFKRIAQSALVFIAPIVSFTSEVMYQNIESQKWADVPMILPEQGLARERVEAWFKTRRVKPRIYAQVAGNEALVSMVSLGLGVGIVPKIVLDNSPLAERVRVLTVDDMDSAYEVGLFTLKKKLQNPIINAFWQHQNDV